MAQVRSRAPQNRHGCIPIPRVTTFLNCNQPGGVYVDIPANRRLNRVGTRRERYRFSSIERGRRTRTRRGGIIQKEINHTRGGGKGLDWKGIKYVGKTIYNTLSPHPIWSLWTGGSVLNPDAIFLQRIYSIKKINHESLSR